MKTFTSFRSLARLRPSRIARASSVGGSHICQKERAEAPWKSPVVFLQIAATEPHLPSWSTTASTLIFTWPVGGGIHVGQRGKEIPAFLAPAGGTTLQSSKNFLVQE